MGNHRGGDQPSLAESIAAIGADYGKNNKIFTKEAADAANIELAKFFSRSNVGFDPKIMQIMISQVGYYVEAGIRSFGQIAQVIIDQFGEQALPYIQAAYAAVRQFPGLHQAGMDTQETVDQWQPRKGIKPTDEASEYQAPYVPRSKGAGENVLIPKNLAEATAAGLDDLVAEVGDLDEYVMGKLGYATEGQLFDAFMGLQVDAIAAAIYQIDKGGAVIIADQTGVGKGRQGAAILRYARRIGRIPIFVTAKDYLFTSTYEDLQAIGETDAAPLILNSDAFVTIEGGQPLFKNKPSSHKAALASMVELGELPPGRNMLWLTYSQITTDNIQRDVLNRLAPNAVFVLDESHNVSGEMSKKLSRDAGDRIIERTGGQAITRARTGAGAMFDAIANSPVVYLSATFAKRPDNMPIYYRTSLLDWVDDVGELVAAVAAGGIPLQTVMSNMLARARQLYRRERSYAGISMPMEVDYENGPEHRRIADEATAALRAIVDASSMFHNRFFEAIQLQAAQAGGTAVQAGNRIEANLSHTEFSSVAHNYVRQLLLGLKVEKAADKAIAAFQAGEKPVIVLENTMGSFIDGHVDNEGLKRGDVVNLTYRDVLQRALYRTMRVSVRDARGESEVTQYEYSDLDPITRAAYDEALAAIEAADVDQLPISPIDAMASRMEAAGMKVGEITGREWTINYAAGGTLVRRSQAERSTGRQHTINQFNNGGIDAIILNAAGSTGLSIHASEEFADQKPRNMIVAQPMQDINLLVQSLGRVNRTGQVVIPVYAFLYTDLPAEKRPAASTAKKLKSLNAQTSANSDSDIGLKAPDMLNKYGDEVVNQYLLENPELAALLNITGLAEPGHAAESGLALKVTGRMALLSVADQEMIYKEIETQYTALINYLDATGTNDLVAHTLDLQAQIIESRIAYEGKAGPETNTTLHKISALAQGKTPEPDEVRATIEHNLEGRTPAEVAEEIVDFKATDTTYKDKLNERASRLIAPAAAARDALEALPEDAPQGQRDKIVKLLAGLESQLQAVYEQSNNYDATQIDFRSKMERFQIGKRFELDLTDEIVYGVVTNVKDTHREGVGNPYSASKTTVTFMVNSGGGRVEVPLMRLTPAMVLQEIFDVPTGRATVDRDQAERAAVTFAAANPTYPRDDVEWGYMRGTRRFTEQEGEPGWMRREKSAEELRASMLEGWKLGFLAGIFDAQAGKLAKVQTTAAFDTWLDEQFKPRATGRRETRYIATGNLIAGSAKLSGGRITFFTDQTGTQHQGVLMPKKFKTKDFNRTGTDANDVRVEGQELMTRAVRRGISLHSGDRTVSLARSRRSSEWQLVVPKSSKGNNVSNTVKFDNELRALTGDFHSAGKIMSVTFPDDKLDAVVGRLLRITGFYANGSDRDLLTEEGARPPPTPMQSFDGKTQAGGGVDEGEDDTHLSAPEPEASVIATPSAPEGWSEAGDSIPAMSIAEIETAIEPMVRAVHASVGLEVEVVPAAMVPQDIIDKNNGYVPAGWIKRGKVYLVQEYAQSPRAAQITLAHEVVGHLGVIRVVGDRWPELMEMYRRIEKSGGKTFNALNDEVSRRYPGAKGNERLAEFIAVLAEHRAKDGQLAALWRLVREAVVGGLRALGIPVRFGMTDIDRLLTRSERYLVTGEGRSSIMRDPNMVAFSKLDPAQYNAIELAAIEQAGFGFQQPKSFVGRMLGMRTDLKTRLRQGLVDQYDSFRSILNDERSWMLAHLVKSNTGAIEAALEFGRLGIDPEGVLTVDTDKKSLKEILAPLGTDLDRFLMWIAGNRAYKLLGEGRENLIEPFNIDVLMNMNAGREQLFDRVRKDFEEFADAIVRIGVETGTIDEAEADEWLNEGFYLPFYRIIDEDTSNVRGVRMLDKDGLVKQKAYIRLKGGKDKVGDLLGNMLMNWHHLIGASLKNQAARRALHAAEQMGAAFRGGNQHDKESVYVRDAGKAQYWTVADPLVLDSLTSLNFQGLNGPMMKAMRMFKRALTLGVTVSPEFKIANLLRDSIQAAAVADMSTKIYRNLYEGFKMTKAGSKTKAAMLAGGAIFAESGYIHGADPDAMRKLITKHGRHIVVDTRNAARKLFDRYQDFGTRLENVNRAANYEAAMLAGRGTLSANFEARDQLDFSRTGGWLAVRAMTQVIPFLNARLQGLDKLGRAAMDPKQRLQFFSVVGTYAALSVMLYLMMKDDPDYDQLEQWQRDVYHPFKLPGDDTMYFFPRPFEVGSIATLAERVVEQMVNDEAHGELFAERLLFALTQTFQVNPIPQLFKPALEVGMNRSYFTGRPIETEGMRNMSPENRKRAWTSQTAILASQGMSKVLWDDVVLSPVQIESLVRGYLGWVGATVLGATDRLISRPIVGAPTQPAIEWANVTRFAHQGPIRNTKYTTVFYDRLNELDKLWGDMRQYRLEHNLEATRELLGEHPELRTRKAYNRAARNLTNINHQLQIVYNDQRLTAEQKRTKIQALEQRKNALTERIVRHTEEAFQ